jgi:capsular polysaccharide biosynthesis protein
MTRDVVRFAAVRFAAFRPIGSIPASEDANVTTETQQPQYYDDVIDLRAYILVLWKFWPVILGMIIVAVLAAAGLALSRPAVYEATASVVITQSRSELSMVPEFKTTAEDFPTNADARRNALIGLVRNPTIAAEVIARIGDTLPPELRDVSNLVAAVEGTSTGDLITINVRAQDPGVAMAVANAWASAYERHTNQLYGVIVESGEAIARQARSAKQEYDTAEAALIDFTSRSRIAEYTRRIGQAQNTISQLQEAKQSAIKAITLQEYSSAEKIATTYANALTDNRIIALTKEQESKRQLFSAYIDAAVQERLAAVEQESQARIASLTDKYAARRRLARIATDARALLSELQQPGASGASSNSLAFMLLKTQAYASSADLPTQLQVQIDSLDAAEPDVGTIEALIAAVEASIADLDAAIAQESQELVTGQNQGLSAISQPEGVPLDDAIRTRYQELFELSDLAAATDTTWEDSDLLTSLHQAAADLSQVSTLGLLSGLLTETSSLDATIEELEAEVRELQAKLETETATRQQLVQARDLAWETYTTMARKLAEVSAGSAMQGTIVRFAAPAALPAEPVSRKLLQTAALAGAVAFMLAVGVAFVTNLLNPNVDPSAAFRTRRASPAT